MADGVYVDQKAYRAFRARRSESWFANNCRQKFDAAPKHVGQRELIAVERMHTATNRWHYVAVVRCQCGHIARPSMAQWNYGVSKRGGNGKAGVGAACQSCTGLRRGNPNGCRPAEELDARAGEAVTARRRALLDLPTDQDPHYKLLRQAYPDGCTLEVLADFYGLTRERIRQIEATALRKLRNRDLYGDGELADTLEHLRTRTTEKRGYGSSLDWDELPTLESGQ